MIKRIPLVLIALLFGLFLLNCSNSSLNDLELLSSSSLQGISSPSSDGNRLYLGRGYDVIHSSYINRDDVKKAFPVLDQEKMIRDGIIISEPTPGQQVFQMFTGTSRTEFYKNRNESINAGLNADIPFKAVLFSGKFNTEFNLSQSDSRIETSMYLRGRSYRYTQDEYIMVPTAERLVKYLDENFIANLRSRNATQILDWYGSHVLIQYNKGGAMEFNYVYNGSVLKSNEQLSNALNVSLSARVFDFGGGVSSGTSGGTSSDKNELESKSAFYSLVYGGTPVNASSLEQVESNYGTWLNSIVDNADICGIGRFDQSFIPIWELVDASGEPEFAKELKAEFEKRATEQGKALLVKRSTITVEREDFTAGNNIVYTFDKGYPATIEVYALGAGGGGQGGHTTDWLNFIFIKDTDHGTGGSGGGGASAYMKFDVQQSTDFRITVGPGGSGGATFYQDNYYSAWQSGYSGSDGGSTTVTWNGNTLTAAGGEGGGKNRNFSGSQCSGDNAGTNRGCSGGNGGTTSNMSGAVTASGWKGSEGIHNSQLTGNRGGSAGEITTGSINPFPSLSGVGVGGNGGYSKDQPGSDGKNGLVIILATYSIYEEL